MNKFVLKFFGETTLVGNIKDEQINEFIKKYRQGRKPKTMKNIFTDLNALLNYAVQKKLLKVNPANFANRELIGNTKSKKPQLNLDEVRMALSVLNDKRVLKRERVWFLVGIMTGGRMDEVNRAQWPDVDWTAREIHIRGTKTDSADAKLPIPPPLFAELVDLYRHRETSDYIFPGASSQTKNKKIYSRRRLFEKIRKLVFERYDRHIKLTPKDLRDIYATDVSALVRDPETLMHLMRHSSLTTTTKYLRGVKDRMVEAAKGVGQQWVPALTDDEKSLGATSGGHLGVEIVPKRPQNAQSDTARLSPENPLTTRNTWGKIGGGGQSRTVDAADMSRVL